MTSSNFKDVKIGPNATVCVESIMTGTISIGSKTVVHPKASINAEAGPIIIGESNIFEEQSLVKNALEDGNKLIIGKNNVFETGATVLAKAIGDHNVFESKCYVGPDIEVGNGCIIGAGVTLTVEEKLPDNIIITGSGCHRRMGLEKPPPQTLQLDFLSKVLPNYHYIKKLK